MVFFRFLVIRFCSWTSIRGGQMVQNYRLELTRLSSLVIRYLSLDGAGPLSQRPPAVHHKDQGIGVPRLWVP